MSEIDHLAGLVGIEDGYWDVAGQWHITPAGTKLALIAALRLDPEDTAGIEAAAGDLSWPGPDGPVPACPLPQDSGSAGHGA
jgi:hypothetical protein